MTDEHILNAGQAVTRVHPRFSYTCFKMGKVLKFYQKKCKRLNI